MKPLFHPRLVNDPFGDPGVYIEFQFEKRALQFDLGDLHHFPARKILKLTDIFVSHAHMDHFIGFDWVLRLFLGREKHLRLFGPPGFVDRIHHKLSAYSWNLVDRFDADFEVTAFDVQPDGLYSAEFRCRSAFRRENEQLLKTHNGVILREDTFLVRAATLDHRIPCLAFSLEESLHVNIMKNRLDAMGLPVGPWLKALKRAVLRGEPDQTPFRVWWTEKGETRQRWIPLGDLKSRILTVAPGQKITYIVDAVYHPENAAAIVRLAEGSDYLFIEASFLQQDAARAAERYHLTAHQAGLLAKTAGVKRLIPFHFSPRYTGQAHLLLRETEEAFGSPLYVP